MTTLKAFCKALPKIELHAHINGSISRKLLQVLYNKSELRRTKQQNEMIIGNHSADKSLDNCFHIFAMMHSMICSMDIASQVCRDVIQDFYEDGVCYLELRTTPREFPSDGITRRLYIEKILEVIAEDQQERHGSDIRSENPIIEDNIHVTLLVSLDRSHTAEITNEIVDAICDIKKRGNRYLVGVDLSGDPHKGDVNVSKAALLRVKEAGLRISVHISEIADRDEETLILLSTQPDRLGHATFLHQESPNNAAVQFVKQYKIPIELCLTSNIQCGTVSSFTDHHLLFWKESNHPFAICTDDKGVFDCCLSDELCTAATTFNLNKHDLYQLMCDTMQFSFASEYVKQVILYRLQCWRKHFLQSL